MRYRARSSGLGAAAADARMAGRTIEQEFHPVTEVAAEADVAGWLGIATGETVLLRRRLIRLEDDSPLQMATNYVPLRLVTDQMREENTGPGGTYARIEDQGRTLTHYQEDFAFRPATPAEREELELDDMLAAVVDFRRVAYAGEEAVECFTSVMAASRYAFSYTIPAG